jgi:hypothetical protein
MMFYIINPLVNALVSTILGFIVYFKNKKDSVNKFFALFCGLVAIWSYSYFVWQMCSTEKSAIFWARILMAAAIFYTNCLFSFCFEIV